MFDLIPGMINCGLKVYLIATTNNITKTSVGDKFLANFK
jgi:hypothetical protein